MQKVADDRTKDGEIGEKEDIDLQMKLELVNQS